ncbi:polysaccharide biosynthesis/export family protein [Kaistia adipata]|uniref:polysaccharide biosynthesis/export family protein n=1 Tax=Kaistia adipata TaxID=166954 RepID=UPI00040E28DE|nr:polysaccharide biosynthesis/export family protein [Kaistia adipata]
MTRVGLVMLAALAASVASNLAIAADVAAEYRISPGDTVQINIATVPDGSHQATVQLDGTVALPQIGMIPVAGLTLAELQSRLERTLPATIFRIRLADGREQAILLKPSDVTAAIVDYRPIYIKGDVLTPGQQPYRPLMTVRQAVAVAGGYSLMRSRMTQSVQDPIDLQGAFDSLWTDYVREYFRKQRVEAELQGKPGFDTSAPAGCTLPPDVVAAIARNETDLMNTARDDAERERVYLEQAQKAAGDQIEVLLKRERDEAASLKADEDEVAKVKQVYEAGNLTNTRMADMRRALLLSSSRRLETTVELMRTRYQQGDYARQLERSVSQRRTTLLQDLAEANVRLADLAIKLRAASEKLHLLGGSRPTPSPTGAAGVKVSIIRREGGSSVTLSVDEDAEVRPGDVIEATFADSLGLGVAAK